MQILFVNFMCSSDPGAADGARLCAAPEGAPENPNRCVDRAGHDTPLCAVCTSTKPRTISHKDA